MFKKIGSSLESIHVGWIMLFTMLLSIGYDILDPAITIDTSAQAFLGQQYLEGQEWKLPVISKQGEVHWKEGHDFMPIHGILSAKIGQFTGQMYSGFAFLNWVYLVHFLIAYYFLLARINPTNKQFQHLGLCLMGFLLAPIKYLTPNELLATGGIMWGINGLLGILNPADKSRVVWQGLLLAGGWALALGTRLAYFPFILIPITLIGSSLLTGFLQTKKFDAQNSILLLSFVGCIIIALGSLIFHGSNNDSPIGDSSQLYLPHLAQLTPFPVQSFLYLPQNVVQQLANKLHLPFWVLRTIMGLVSVGIIGIILATYRKRKDQPSSWIGISFLLFVINGLLLAYLSLSTKAETWNAEGFWTYVQEPRYFFPSMLFILIHVVDIATHASLASSKRTIAYFLMLCLIGNLGLIFALSMSKSSPRSHQAPWRVYEAARHLSLEQKSVFVYPSEEMYAAMLGGAKLWEGSHTTQLPDSLTIILPTNLDLLQS